MPNLDTPGFSKYSFIQGISWKYQLAYHPFTGPHRLLDLLSQPTPWPIYQRPSTDPYHLSNFQLDRWKPLSLVVLPSFIYIKSCHLLPDQPQRHLSVPGHQLSYHATHNLNMTHLSVETIDQEFPCHQQTRESPRRKSHDGSLKSRIGYQWLNHQRKPWGTRRRTHTDGTISTWRILKRQSSCICLLAKYPTTPSLRHEDPAPRRHSSVHGSNEKRRSHIQGSAKRPIRCRVVSVQSPVPRNTILLLPGTLEVRSNICDGVMCNDVWNMGVRIFTLFDFLRRRCWKFIWNGVKNERYRDTLSRLREDG
jgi:hypothetical protein